jgi:hypothetical protein
MEKVGIKVHGDVSQGGIFRFGEPVYEKRDGLLDCSYCGSFHPKDALELLKKGVHASGSDWKYGWPHKFYISGYSNGGGKFYSKHLYDADEKTFEELTDLLAKKLGIRFNIDEKGLSYIAPYGGFQTWYGSDFDEEAPKVPEDM